MEMVIKEVSDLKQYYEIELGKMSLTGDSKSDLLKINSALVSMGVKGDKDVIDDISLIIYGPSDKEKRTGNVGIPTIWGDGKKTMIPCEAMYDGDGDKSFTQFSPISVIKENGVFYINSDLEGFSFKLPFEVLAGPSWYSNISFDQTYSKLIQSCFNGIISAVPTSGNIQKCEFQCEFCGLESKVLNLTPDILGEVIGLELESGKEQVDLTLSGGSLNNGVGGILKFLPYLELKKKYGDKLHLELEFSPPVDISSGSSEIKYDYLDMLIEGGVDSVLINLESANSDVAKEVMPAKAAIGMDNYFKTMEYMVDHGVKVSSLILIGLYNGFEDEHYQEVVDVVEKLTDIGVSVVPQPFKPFILTPLQQKGYKPCSPALTYKLTKDVVDIAFKKGLVPTNGGNGCSGCGKCSLDTNYAEAVYGGKK